MTEEVLDFMEVDCDEIDRLFLPPNAFRDVLLTPISGIAPPQGNSFVNLFVKAYVAHCDWYKFQSENMGNALFIKAKYYILIGFPLVISFLLGLTVNFIYDCIK